MQDFEKFEASNRMYISSLTDKLDLRMYDKTIKRYGFLSRCEERVMFEKIIEIQNSIICELITHKVMFDYLIQLISEALYSEDIMYLVHFNVDEMGDLSVSEIIDNYHTYFEICENCSTVDELISTLSAVKLSNELFNTIVKNTPDDIANKVHLKDKLSIIDTYRGNICEHNYALVIYQFTKLSRKSDTLTFGDLVQEGMIGLNKAVEKFNPYLKTKFSTMATGWIFAEIVRAIDNSSGLISVPCNILAKYYKAVDEVKAIIEKGGVPDEELVKFITDVKFTYLTLNQPIANEGRNSRLCLSEVLEDKGAIGALENIIVNELCSNVGHVIRALPEKEKLIITSLYGINEKNEKMTNVEIMTSLRIKSYEYNKIKMNAFRLLKDVFESSNRFNNWNLILESN